MNRKIYTELKTIIEERFGHDMAGDESFFALVHSLDDRILDTYFGWDQTKGQEGGYWTQQINFVTRNTGQLLVDRIGTDTTKTILDVGCGDNEFKTYFGDRLTGIDPYNERADIQISLEDYWRQDPEQADIVFALGSINFGNAETIRRQVEKIVDLCKPGGMIAIRVNPGITHDHPKAQWIDFFEWDEDYIRKFAEQNDCDVEVIGWDHPNEETIRWGNRYYSIWHKKI